MHHSRSVGILFAVAVLIVGLAVPATAKKGGHPGPPSGTGLEVTVEPSSGFMWANSVDDQILFDITVTNSSGGDLTGVSVTFEAISLLTNGSLAKNASWTWQYTYTVTSLAGLPVSEQSQVDVGTVIATAGTVSDSAPAFMTAYPILPCNQGEDGPFTFGSNEAYDVCSFTGTGEWTLTTTLTKAPRGKSNNPSATVRDGVPGNWCDYDENGALRPGEPYLEGGVWKVDSVIYLPTDGTCLHGGAGGEPIPVRNTDTFYLATWQGNVVNAAPTP